MIPQAWQKEPAVTVRVICIFFVVAMAVSAIVRLSHSVPGEIIVLAWASTLILILRRKDAPFGMTMWTFCIGVCALLGGSSSPHSTAYEVTQFMGLSAGPLVWTLMVKKAAN